MNTNLNTILIIKFKYMKLIKFTLASTAICSAIMAILLIWSEDVVTCGITTCKVLETMFICVAVKTAQYSASINLTNHE